LPRDAALALRETAEGVTVRLRVTPRARRDRIEGAIAEADGSFALKVSVAAPPDKGRANEAVIALLARALGVPKSRLAVAQGAASRHKTLRVAGDPGALARRLRGLAEARDG
jgi:uncharacterized protein (TIGR00251 family)